MEFEYLQKQMNKFWKQVADGSDVTLHVSLIGNSFLDAYYSLDYRWIYH